MKRICLFSCALMLFFTVRAAALPTAEEVFDAFEPPAAAFTDMAAYGWAEEAVDYLYRNGMISGVGGNMFAPQLNVTRLEFIKMVCTACAIVDKNAEASYSDTPLDHWGYIYAASARKAGIIDIYSGEFLGSSTDITREDMAYIADRAISLFAEDAPGTNAMSFADDSEIADYAKESVYRLKSMGIISGRGENLFEPKGTATRAEAAKIIYNVSLKVSENYLDK